MLVCTVVLLATGWALWHEADTRQVIAHPAHHRAGSVPAAVPSTDQSASAEPVEDRSAQDWPVFAHVGELQLILPNPGAKAVAYHQASYPDALPLVPVGHLLKNYAGHLFHAPQDTPGPRYIVQPQRTGRTTRATTAVDIVAPDDMDIYAPVTGTVVKVKRYKLYGQYPDIEVEIKPDDQSGYRVVMIHLDDVAVQDGDHVSATLDPIGTPRVFPFHSVVNDYVGGGDPHVHLEVKAAP